MSDEDKVNRQVILNLRAQFQNAEQVNEIDVRKKLEELREAKLNADLSELALLNSLVLVYRTIGRKDLENGIVSKINAIAEKVGKDDSVRVTIEEVVD